MRYNAMFEEIAGVQSLSAASPADLPEFFRQVVLEGWVKDDQGAWLLSRLRSTYSGSPEAFTDLTGYEAAVNGRAIPDFDLDSRGQERARDLAKRGYVFARMALLRLSEIPDHPPGCAYVSINPVEVDDEEVYAGNVTIVTHHDGEPPYVRDVEGMTSSAVLALASSDCADALPPRGD